MSRYVRDDDEEPLRELTHLGIAGAGFVVALFRFVIIFYVVIFSIPFIKAVLNAIGLAD